MSFRVEGLGYSWLAVVWHTLAAEGFEFIVGGLAYSLRLLKKIPKPGKHKSQRLHPKP